MTAPPAATAAPVGRSPRFDVRAPDGTSITVWPGGSGPAIVLVHGSIADHTTLDPFVAVLRRSMATFCPDRRGFGASGDGDGYAIEQDFDDIAAVVDAVAARTGGPVALFGHSYGANVAMGAATRTGNVHHLVLYEPSLGLPYPPGAIDRIDAALAAGDREAAIVEVLVGILEMGPEDIEVLRSDPLWPTRLAAAHTVPRECRAEEGWVFAPGQFDAITAPTLFLAGSDSLPVVARATADARSAVPHAETVVLHGHGHFAHKADPDLVASVIAEFLDG